MVPEKNLNKLNVNSIYNNNDEYKPVTLGPSQNLSESSATYTKFKELFSNKIIDYDKLKQYAWDGIPPGFSFNFYYFFLKEIP